ncbi:MAG: protein-export chaperone SecB [Deferrisomatales bacterium]
MSQGSPRGGEPPTLRLQKMYVKDLSFENPNAPGVYRERAQPRAEVNLAVGHRQIEGQSWEVTVRLEATLTADEAVVFIVEIEHAGVFVVQGVPADHLPRVLNVDCPTLLFPFTRQIVCQAVVDGGFAPFLLEPVNFLALYQNARKDAQSPPAH